MLMLALDTGGLAGSSPIDLEQTVGTQWRKEREPLAIPSPHLQRTYSAALLLVFFA